MDNNQWIIELESALLDDGTTANDIYSICNGRQLPESIRSDVWKVCLDVRHKADQLSQFNGIFDLPNQRQLRSDCAHFVENLGNDDEDKVSILSDLESILTFYCKSRALTYEKNNGWIEMLLPLISLKLPRSDTYNLFEKIRDIFIPKRNPSVYSLFRLLLQYHDPELCSLLDTKRIVPDLYIDKWFQSLFAATCTLPIALSIWDVYFQQDDPFLLFFLGLIIVINGRDCILALKSEGKEAIIETLVNMPGALEQDDVLDFCSLAQYYNQKTPASFKTDLLQVLFGSSEPKHVTESYALCLPVSVYELVDKATTERRAMNGVTFFLVDCRPAEQYNSGHLATAFHVDIGLMLQEPTTAYATAMQGLLQAQKQAIQSNSNAGGEHLCFMGSGNVDEDKYMHMVVASFLQKNAQYVSILSGGYAAIHNYFGDHMTDCLEDHNASKCLLCVAKRPAPIPVKVESKPNVDIFTKISDSFKIKSAEVKEKLIDYIANPHVQLQQQSQQHQQDSQERHVQPHERNSGPRYRNLAPIFSIDDVQEPNEVPWSQTILNNVLPDKNKSANVSSPTAAGSQDVVKIDAFLRQPDVVHHFKCEEVQMTGTMYDSYLVITDSHLIILRDLAGGKGTVIARRKLSSIIKITAKKRHRDLITFKYGMPDPDDKIILTDMDRFLIPNANTVTTIISRHIVQNVKV